MTLRPGIVVLCLICFSALVSAPVECQTFDRIALFAWPAVQATAAPRQVAPPLQLTINIIEGADAVNTVGARTAREFAVEVDDQNHHPVSGAMVTFFVPNDGPGGTFPGDRQLLSVTTDVNGRAVAHSFRPNRQLGEFRIQVTATYGNEKASAYISQSNQKAAAEPVANRHTGKKLALIAVGVVAAAAAIIAGVELSHGGGNSATPTATLGLGSGPTVGALH